MSNSNNCCRRTCNNCGRNNCGCRNNCCFRNNCGCGNGFGRNCGGFGGGFGSPLFLLPFLFLL